MKPVNTPMANSGTSVSTFPRTAMSSTPDRMDSASPMAYWASRDTVATGTTTMVGLTSGLPGMSPRPRSRPTRR